MVKPVTPFLYDQAFRLQEELSFSPHIRLPVDGNNVNRALIFQHYTEDFLSFMQSGPVSRSQVKRILWDILKGIAACHSKDWVHCGNDFLYYLHDLKELVWLLTSIWYLDTDVKPNNVLISYTSRSGGVREIDRVSLSDIEDATRVKSGEGVFVQVGNVLWRSPEA